jgi:hypothetical protein
MEVFFICRKETYGCQWHDPISFFLTVHGVCIKYMLLWMFVNNSAQGVIVISCASNGSVFLIIFTYAPLVFPVRALE